MASERSSIRSMTRRDRRVRRSLRAILTAVALLTTLTGAPSANGLAGVQPSNDLFASAPYLAIPFTDSAVDLGYASTTLEPGETDGTDCYRGVTRTVWYRIQSPVAMPVSVKVSPAGGSPSDVDPTIAIWSGTSLGALSPVTCVDDYGAADWEQASFVAASDATYYLQVGAWGPADTGGPVDVVVQRSWVGNELFDFATQVGAIPFSEPVDLTLAAERPEAGEPVPTDCAAEVDSSIWYRLTVDALTPVGVLATPGESNQDLDPLIAVWSGTTLGGLTPIGCVDAAYLTEEYLSFTARPGTTYYIEIADVGASNGDVLDVSIDGAFPLNDLSDSATPVGALPVTETVDTRLASVPLEPDEPGPSCYSDIDRTLWYAVALPATRTVRVRVTPLPIPGLRNDPVIGVWQGAALGDLTEVDCVDDGSTDQREQLDFVATAGMVYWVQVGMSVDPGRLEIGFADAAAPNLGATKVGVLAGALFPTSGSSVPTRVTWSGAAASGSTIVRYTLQQSVDGGAFANVALPSASATGIGRTLSAGHTYVYRVRATDTAGRVSLWSTAASVKPTVYQEGSTSIRRGGTWTTVSSSSFYGGKLRYARSAGASASLSFTGRSINWISSYGPTMGKAKIYVDGVYVRTLDLYRSTAAGRRVVFTRTWPVLATHTIKIVVVGTAGRPRIDLDAFVVLP